MVQIVATHSFDHNPQCHIAAFGMVKGFIQIHGREPCDQRQIPFANRGECGERGMRVIAPVGCGPIVLIERLDDVAILGQSLPQPERKYDLAIREMTEYVPDAPLAWSRMGVEFIRAEPCNKSPESSRCGASYRQRVQVSQLRRIWIYRHINSNLCSS